MGRKRTRNRAQVVGLVCYADNDPLAELAIVTDYGQEYPLDPGGQLDDAMLWLDRVVRASGRIVWHDGRSYLRVERAREIPDEMAFADEHGQYGDWDREGSGWPDGGDWREDDDGYESFS